MEITILFYFLFCGTDKTRLKYFPHRTYEEHFINVLPYEFLKDAFNPNDDVKIKKALVRFYSSIPIKYKHLIKKYIFPLLKEEHDVIMFGEYHHIKTDDSLFFYSLPLLFFKGYRILGMELFPLYAPQELIKMYIQTRDEELLTYISFTKRYSFSNLQLDILSLWQGILGGEWFCYDIGALDYFSPYSNGEWTIREVKDYRYIVDYMKKKRSKKLVVFCGGAHTEDYIEVKSLKNYLMFKYKVGAVFLSKIIYYNFDLYMAVDAINKDEIEEEFIQGLEKIIKMKIKREEKKREKIPLIPVLISNREGGERRKEGIMNIINKIKGGEEWGIG